MVTIRNYVRVQTPEEAWTLYQKKNSRILGGMLFTKLESGSVDTMIDLTALGLDRIEETDDAFVIGAQVTLRMLEKHPGLEAYTQGAIRTAVQDIVGVQFRNLATVGGSLYGRYGFSDVLTVFLSMDASVELYKGGVVPLSAYAGQKRDRDLLLRLILKKTPGHFTYEAFRASRTDFPVLTCAVSETGGTYRAVIGARPGRAMLLPDPDHILSGMLTPEVIEAFSDYAKENVPTGGNVRGSAAYRSHLVKILLENCLRKLAEVN